MLPGGRVKRRKDDNDNAMAQGTPVGETDILALHLLVVVAVLISAAHKAKNLYER